MKSFVSHLLEVNLPRIYYYHNLEHTLYVVEKAIEIGEHEKRSRKEIELLTAGALLHDTGYIRTYADHESVSCLLARQFLPGFGYSGEDIDKVWALDAFFQSAMKGTPASAR